MAMQRTSAELRLAPRGEDAARISAFLHSRTPECRTDGFTESRAARSVGIVRTGVNGTKKSQHRYVNPPNSGDLLDRNQKVPQRRPAYAEALRLPSESSPCPSAVHPPPRFATEATVSGSERDVSVVDATHLQATLSVGRSHRGMPVVAFSPSRTIRRWSRFWTPIRGAPRPWRIAALTV